MKSEVVGVFVVSESPQLVKPVAEWTTVNLEKKIIFSFKVRD